MSQHREDRYGSAVGNHRPLTPGPLSIAPRPKDIFVQAVQAGGGEVVELGADTRGLMWLSEKDADQLQAIVDAHPHIEWIQLPWAGVDAFSDLLAHLTTMPMESRPVVTSAKGAYSEPVAEHALTLLLSLMREIPQKARAARWKEQRTGVSLFGAHVVIVGAGGISRALIDLLQVFRCEVTVIRRDATVAVDGASRTLDASALADVLPSADALVLAAAHTSSTRHLIGAKELAQLPAHAVLVNIARGPLVDTDALVDALKERRLAGAGLDVTDPEPLPDGHPLFDLDSCVITSHSADTPEMTAPLLAARISHNTEAFLAGKSLRGVVSPERGY